MNKGKYIFAQLMDFFSRYEFDLCVDRYDGNQQVRRLFCWEHFLALSFGQLSGRRSLRDIVNCLSAHQSKLYHLGFRAAVCRSTLAEANEKRSWKIYRDFAQTLIQKVRPLYQDDTDFSLDLEHAVYAFDSSTIGLCMEVFSWALFRKKKAGIKLHTQIDLRGNIPTFVHITEARVNDVQILDELDFEEGAFYLMDRAYTDTERLHDIQRAKAFFVVRWKKNIRWRRLYSRPVNKEVGLRCDQIIRFSGDLSAGGYPEKLRRIKYVDPETKKTYIFLTNHFDLDAKLIADLYKQRWQVELFFRWIKQHLEIQVCWGTSQNAVHVQAWIAIATYVLVAMIKKTYKLRKSIYEILQILSVSLFDKTPLESLLSDFDAQKEIPDLQQSLF